MSPWDPQSKTTDPIRVSAKQHLQNFAKHEIDLNFAKIKSLIFRKILHKIHEILAKL